MPLGTELGLGPGDTVLDRDQLPHGKGHTFWPTYTVAKWSPILATAELLLFNRPSFPQLLQAGPGYTQENL